MDIKKTIFQDIVILICAAFLLTVSTLMWFRINTTVHTTGISLTSGSTPNVGFEFYIAYQEPLIDADWIPTERLVLSTLVPGQTVYCKMSLNNGGSSSVAVSLDFLDITELDVQDGYRLSDVLQFEGIAMQGVSFANTSTFATLMGANDYFKAVTDARISAGDTIDICFNISVLSDAGNEYSEKSLSVEQIVITTSNI